MTVAEDLESRTTLIGLPSKFLVYEEDECSIRSFTASEVRKLRPIMLGTIDERLADLVDNTISLDANNMTRGDFWYVLAWLRINTFKNAPLSFSWTCPKEHENTLVIDLTSLELIELQSDFREPAYLKLGSGEEIPLRLPRLGDELATKNYLSGMNPDGNYSVDEETLVEIACTVDTPDSLHNKVEVLRALEKTPTGAEDLFIIENFSSPFDHGLPKAISTQCEHCEYVTEVPFPFRFRDFLPITAYRDYIRDSVRFGEESSGTED